jgi:hypothetical protein
MNVIKIFKEMRRLNQELDAIPGVKERRKELARHGAVLFGWGFVAMLAYVGLALFVIARGLGV